MENLFIYIEERITEIIAKRLNISSRKKICCLIKYLIDRNIYIF